MTTRYVKTNGRKIESAEHETDFLDAKNRRVGFLSVIQEFDVREMREDERCSFYRSDERFAAIVLKQKDGEIFGSAQSPHWFDTLAEAQAHVRKTIPARIKSASKLAGSYAVAAPGKSNSGRQDTEPLIDCTGMDSHARIVLRVDTDTLSQLRTAVRRDVQERDGDPQLLAELNAILDALAEV